MVRKFLYFIAIVVVLVVLAGIALAIWSREATEYALVPRGEFVEQQPLEANAYEDPAMWYSRPGIGVDDPARWQPPVQGEGRVMADAFGGDPPDFAVFFVHPTSYIPVNYRDEVLWNAPMDDERADRVAKTFIQGLASPFNSASEIWAPRYRQAAAGVFLTDDPRASQAIDAAYADVKQAFDYFRETVDADTPIVVAGHSQGALHLLRLLREEIAGQPIADRLVAAYVVGWPISVPHDLPALGFPACATASQTGCILSWSSYAEPADPSAVMDVYASSIGFDGQPRRNSQILCTNPITGTFGGSAPAEYNLGTLVPDDGLTSGELVPGAVPARCAEDGLLLIGDPPELGSAVLPGNNYHVYDIPLFWANTKADVNRRVMAAAGIEPEARATPRPSPSPTPAGSPTPSVP